MSKFVDYKCTVWGRLHFNESTDMSKVIEKLKEGYQPSELCDIPELKFESFNYIDETEESLSIIENENMPTIEIYEDDNLLWDNSFENLL